MYSRKKVVIGFSLVVLVVLFLPNSIVNGEALSGKRGFTKVVSDYTIPPSDFDVTIVCDTADTIITPFVHDVRVTLPPVVNASDSTYTISRVDRVHINDNFCIVQPYDNITKIGQHVSPSGNWMLGDGQGITVQSDGTQWYVIGTVMNPSIGFDYSTNNTNGTVIVPTPEPTPEPTTYPAGYCPLWLHLAGQCQ